jgi:formylglycine-generating enzyme required for sulfatase activity/energy-coupling factor transporter ATP-binding protein EcfA2
LHLSASEGSSIGPVSVQMGGGRSRAELRTRYLDEVAREANILPWGVLSEQFATPDNAPPGVADIYTDLDTTEVERVEHETELRQYLARSEQMRRIPAQEMADGQSRLLILGDPGSGKSTFVKHLAYTLAAAGQHSDLDTALQPLEPWSHGFLWPVLVELRAVAAFATDQGIQQGNVRLFVRYLQHLLKGWVLEDAWPVLHDALTTGDSPALLLLDGLDEVDARQRQVLVDMVNALHGDRHFGRHRYVVTSRPYAYYELGPQARLRGFKEVTLAPFSPAQIDRFVANWYRRLADPAARLLKPEEAGKRRQELQRTLRRRDHRELARRPILLTMMVQLDTFTGRLPNDRIELYQAIIDLLLKRWNSRHPGEATLLETIDLPGLREDHLEAALYEVAYRAHATEPQRNGAGSQPGDEQGNEQGDGDETTADLSEDDLRRWLRPHLGDSGDRAEGFVAYIRRRAGLLIWHKSEAYRFPHRTLQEFLAAAHLVTSETLAYPPAVNGLDFPAAAAELVRSDPSRWREVFVLAAGLAARRKRPSDAVAAITNLCPDDCPPPDAAPPAAEWLLAQIAADALLEVGELSARRSLAGQRLWSRIQNWLEQALRCDQALTPRERTGAGQRLARLGDPRPGVLDPLQMEFCHVPAGSFFMGSHEDKLAYNDEKPHEPAFTIPYDYWISRFPVTNAHFRAFVTDGGYANPAFWAEAIAHGLWAEGRVKRYYLVLDDKGEWQTREEMAHAPADYGAPFNLPNHPVVGVSWYEALAFTRWLGERLPAGWRAVLPNEPEWEKAARGGLDITTQPLIVPLCELAAVGDPAATEPNRWPARRYPWGNDIDANCLNYGGTEIGATSAVGCFPGGRSPYGVEELSGNVWEWTRSLWGAYLYSANQSREDLAAGTDERRVVRGGAFDDIVRGVRCAVRSRLAPVFRDLDLGVRVVVLSPSTSGL